MIPVKQTKTVKTHGTGNCAQAVVASLCDLDIDQVPDFKLYENNFWPELRKFFRENYKDGGYELCEETDVNDITMDDYYMAIGLTNRSKDIYHVVIYKDGKPVFDPHPDNSFLLGDPTYYLIPTKTIKNAE